MRGIFAILAVAWHLMGFATDIKYLSVERPVVPDMKVLAVEARVAHEKAYVGSGRLEQWALSWGDVTVGVSFDFRNFVEGVDEPQARLECNGWQSTLDRGFNSAGGYNTLALEWGHDGRVTVLFGDRELFPVMVLDSLPRPSGELHISSEEMGMIDVADILVEVDSDDISRLMTNYSDDELADGVQLRYLDRENDPQLALLGGRYILSRVGDELIYMGGAQTNTTHWRRGMLKGRLKPTGYAGYYHLEWYDATGRLLSDGCYAEIDDKSKTMTLVFPSLSASLRFAIGQ